METKTPSSFTTRLVFVLIITTCLISWIPRLVFGICGRLDVMPSSTTLIPSIAFKAVAHVKDFLQENSSLMGRRLLLNNFSLVDSLFLFYAHWWTDTSKTGKLGFFISNHTHAISCAGCCTFKAESPSEAGIKALGIAVRTSVNRQLNIRHFLHCNHDLSQITRHCCSNYSL